MKNNPLLTVCMLLAVAVTSSTAAATLANINLTVVTSLADSGAGSLRSAILAANAVSYNISFTKNGLMTLTPEPESNTIISFATNGVISLVNPLPYVTKTVTIDGTSAPGYSTSPVLSVNFNGMAGLTLAPGSAGSAIKGLSLVGAVNAAITLEVPNVTIAGNYIGLATNGIAQSNYGDGIQALSKSSNNLIGSLQVEQSIGYSQAGTNTAIFSTNFSGWQGLRNDASSTNLIFAGTASTNGVFYIGPITCDTGTAYYLSYPLTNQNNTSAYGPDNASFTYNTNTGEIQYLSNGVYRVVGSYVLKNDPAAYDHGFVWDGTTADLGLSPTSGTYRTIDYCTVNAMRQTNFRATYQYTHSTMGGLAVGNADSASTINFPPKGFGIAYICKLTNEMGSLTNASDFVTIPAAPLHAKSMTAYGIWDNGLGLSASGSVISHSYTICGGYSPLAVDNMTNTSLPLTQGKGYLVDYDSVSGKFTNWTTLNYPGRTDAITHLEGICSTEAGVYNLAAGCVIPGTQGVETCCWVSVNRNANGTFGQGSWVTLNYPGASNNVLNDNDAVYGNNAVCETIAQTNGSTNLNAFGYQAGIQIGFHAANVISGNKGNGIDLIGSSGNTISQNYIGTAPDGKTAVPNTLNGIQCIAGSSRNLIGGQFVESNNPTGSENPSNAVFQQPPLGNVISGNRQNGVLICQGSVSNTISGNFIGTDVTGTNYLGNWLIGVDIENANGNSLLGCGFYQNPFVYYNVISGNGSHGVRVNNSTNITIQGNYIGIDALDTTNIPNFGDGVWVSGASKNVQMGGVIPLGSVISGNLWNGIEISDTASYVTNFNTFCGAPSFKTYAVPNGMDGFLITSTGGHNTLRTCVVSGNNWNGIEIGGNASGVTIEDTTAGTETDINAPLPNQANGIVLSGTAHGNSIGGFQPSIETSVHASGNVGYGIAVLDGAYSNSIVNTRVGVGLAVTEGGPLPAIPNQMGGVYLDQGTYGTTVGGTKPIQANFINNNGGDGLTIISSRQNKIAGNTINTNDIGVYATGDCTGTVLSNNIVTNNASTNYDTSTATNLIVR